MIPQTQQEKGPVGVKKRTRIRPRARGRPATKGSFKKGCAPGPGRPRGVPNKFTGDLKEAILAGVNGSNEQGVAGFVLDLSLDTPTSAAALLGRLIPVNMAGALDGTLIVRHVDETAADPEAKPDSEGAGQRARVKPRTNV
jgi:hypothetical protein